MQELINISSKPAILDVNFDELKIHLATELEKYKIVVTADTVAGAKKLATELNLAAGALDLKRKAAVVAVSAPIKLFDTNMKELHTMYKDGRQGILVQVKKFENETKETARKLLELHCAAMFLRHGVSQEFKRAEYDDLILISSVTAGGKLTAGAKGKLEMRVVDDKSRQDKTERRLLELENYSLKAGLLAPLTRHHVAHFLFADDVTYATELQQVLDAEVLRQAEAENQLRLKIERENRQEQERQDRLAEHEARKAQGKAPAPEEKKPEPEWPKFDQAEEPHPRTAAKPSEDGTTRWLVTCSFDISLPSNVSEEKIKANLKKQLGKAGFTSLKSVTTTLLDSDGNRSVFDDVDE